MLTLRQFNIGPPVYAHLLDYDVMEDGQSIGRIMEQRELLPGRKWAWYLQITGAHRAGVLAWGYGASLEDAKTAFRASLEGWHETRIPTRVDLIAGGCSRSDNRRQPAMIAEETCHGHRK
jgi:hypothetical protein